MNSSFHQVFNLKISKSNTPTAFLLDFFPLHLSFLSKVFNTWLILSVAENKSHHRHTKLKTEKQTSTKHELHSPNSTRYLWLIFGSFRPKMMKVKQRLNLARNDWIAMYYGQVVDIGWPTSTIYLFANFHGKHKNFSMRLSVQIKYWINVKWLKKYEEI